MYRLVHGTFWTDPTVRRFTPQEKLFFLYLLSSPHGHLCGLYHLPVCFAAVETGLPAARCGRLLKSNSRPWRYDPVAEVVFVVNMLRYQCRRSENVAKNIAKHLATLHNTHLIGDFLKVYADWRIPFEAPTQAPSDTLRTQEENQDKRLGLENPPIVPPRGDEYPPDFEEFWKTYPRKVGKGAAVKAWKKAKGKKLQDILQAVKAQRRSEQWQKNRGEFIPHPTTWLNERRWEDELNVASCDEFTEEEIQAEMAKERARREKAKRTRSV